MKAVKTFVAVLVALALLTTVSAAFAQRTAGDEVQAPRHGAEEEDPGALTKPPEGRRSAQLHRPSGLSRLKPHSRARPAAMPRANRSAIAAGE
jgi:hypothetical protein